MKKNKIIQQSDIEILTNEGVVIFNGYDIDNNNIYYIDIGNTHDFPVKYVFNEQPFDIMGILPPEQIMTGQPYFFLKDMKDLGSYRKIKKDNKGTEFEVNSKQVSGYLQLRSSVTNDTTLNLWSTIEAICNQSNQSSNTNSYLGLNYLFVEADIAILEEVVPSGIRLADGTLKFRDWTVGEDYLPQPFKQSVDGTKVILRCALGGNPILTDELLVWINYRNTSTYNIKLMSHFECINLMETASY